MATWHLPGLVAAGVLHGGTACKDDEIRVVPGFGRVVVPGTFTE